MPIHSAGYRSWDGDRVPGSTRWAVISSTGIKRTWKSTWLRRMLFASIMPALFLAIPFFLFEQATRDPRMWQSLVGFLRGLPEFQVVAFDLSSLSQSTNLGGTVSDQIQGVRHTVWAYLLLTLFRYPQATLMVLIVGIAAPPLISHDVRSRAFLIYFSRPITRLEYMLGKMGTVMFFMAIITTLPALLLYVAGVMLSASTSVMLATWDLPLRILVASVVLSVPTTAIALMFSSITTESRIASFSWFAMWVLGHVIYNVVLSFSAVSSRRFDPESFEPGWRVLLSPYHTLGVVQSWIFGLETKGSPVVPAMVLLTIVTVVSLAVLYRRISAPMRA